MFYNITMTNANETARRRQSAASRAAIIAALGMEPEAKDAPRAERYAASTGEMWGWLAQQIGVEAANVVRGR